MAKLFNIVSHALARKVDGVERPVSAGKELHLLAPNFFPLWDRYIASGYDCPYTIDSASALRYNAYRDGWTSGCNFDGGVHSRRKPEDGSGHLSWRNQ